MSSDFAGLAGTAITTIGTVMLAGEVIKATRRAGREAGRQPMPRRSRKYNPYKVDININKPIKKRKGEGYFGY